MKDFIFKLLFFVDEKWTNKTRLIWAICFIVLLVSLIKPEIAKILFFVWFLSGIACEAAKRFIKKG